MTTDQFPHLTVIRRAHDIAVARLANALARAGLTPPSTSALSDFLADFFNNRDFELAASILTPPDLSQYRVIRKAGELAHRIENTTDDFPVLRREADGSETFLEYVNVAVSEPAALAHVLTELDENRIVPDSIDWLAGGSLVFTLAGQPLAKIEPAVFEEVDPVGIARVKKLLQGIQESGDDHRLAKRLATLPGLAGLTSKDEEGENAVPRYAAVSASLESMVVMLRNGLRAQFGFDLKQHQAQDLTAATFFGLPWQVVRALTPVETPIHGRASVISDNFSGKAYFYRSGVGAVWDFAKQLDAIIREHGAEAVHPWPISSFGTDTAPALSAHRLSYEEDMAYYLLAYRQRGQDLPPPPPGYNEAPVLAMQHLYCVEPCNEDRPVCQPEKDLLTRLYAGGPEKLLANLRAEFLRAGSDLDHAVAANQRAGRQHTLRIKSWLFSLDATRAGDRPQTFGGRIPHLRIERIREDGSLSGERKTVAAYKAEMSVNDEGPGFVLKEDYGRKLGAVFDDFTIEDVRRLEQFSQVWTVPSPD